MKVLYWGRTGFCLWAKRLEQGRFLSDWRQIATKEMDWNGLKLLLEGSKASKRRSSESATDTPVATMPTV